LGEKDYCIKEEEEEEEEMRKGGFVGLN